MRISDWSSDVCSPDLTVAPSNCQRSARPRFSPRKTRFGHIITISKTVAGSNIETAGILLENNVDDTAQTIPAVAGRSTHRQNLDPINPCQGQGRQSNNAVVQNSCPTTSEPVDLPKRGAILQAAQANRYGGGPEG